RARPPAPKSRRSSLSAGEAALLRSGRGHAERSQHQLASGIKANGSSTIVVKSYFLAGSYYPTSVLIRIRELPREHAVEQFFHLRKIDATFDPCRICCV